MPLLQALANPRQYKYGNVEGARSFPLPPKGVRRGPESEALVLVLVVTGPARPSHQGASGRAELAV